MRVAITTATAAGTAGRKRGSAGISSTPATVVAKVKRVTTGNAVKAVKVTPLTYAARFMTKAQQEYDEHNARVEALEAEMVKMKAEKTILYAQRHSADSNHRVHRVRTITDYTARRNDMLAQIDALNKACIKLKVKMEKDLLAATATRDAAVSASRAGITALTPAFETNVKELRAARTQRSHIKSRLTKWQKKHAAAAAATATATVTAKATAAAAVKVPRV